MSKKIFEIIFRDNGSGFNPEGQGSADSGYGLKNIRQRIEKTGGTVRIESKPGGGTTVILVFPAAGAVLETA